MGKLSMVTIVLTVLIASNPAANAVAGGVAAAKPFGPYVSLEQGSNCDSNYEGACVPIDSDVDCEGGGGNGPSYVQGPVRVVGKDIYKLDNNGDGVGCEG
jgi:hypothetical protein